MSIFFHPCRSPFCHRACAGACRYLSNEPSPRKNHRLPEIPGRSSVNIGETEKAWNRSNRSKGIDRDAVSLFGFLCRYSSGPLLFNSNQSVFWVRSVGKYRLAHLVYFESVALPSVVLAGV
jgi:hypothetical protein